ncbi:MBL fold metallo-hydrolase [Arthrobacter sp. GCM10027362]|uniref:MBL fold metallo-hydrolase n=1 Tax=Arthrobacter sp. GCM10027362 TaxID=3273379 RepID=UPI0036359A05
MCDDAVSKAMNRVPSSSRRGFLRAAGVAAVAGGLAGVTAPAAVAAAPAGRSKGPKHRTRLVLLGTAGGPALMGEDRYGVSTAVVYEDKVYVVDLGHGAQTRLLQAGLGAEGLGGTSMANVRGIFFTHLHSDHLVEWPAVYATADMNITGRPTKEPIRVFGPGDRGSLVRVFPPGRPAPELYNPEDPTPGIAGMTGYLRQAFAADFNDRARDSNNVHPDRTFEVRDIDISPYWAVTPEGIPPRLAAPIQVWEDGDVTVTATLVDHRPTAPVFAYRFDTPDGSVVISGDTCVSQNLIDLARDCDYLVHEVIDPQFAENLAASLPPSIGGPLKEHLLASHTSIEQVGRDVAEPAGAKNLVLSHLVPPNNPADRWRKAQKGYAGKLTVGEDLMEFGLGPRNR